MSKTYEYRLGLANSYVYHAWKTQETYQVLPYMVNLKAPVRDWNPLSKTVYGKSISFRKKTRHVNIWNDRKSGR